MSESEPKKRRLKTDTGAVRVNLADEEGEDEEGEDEEEGTDRGNDGKDGLKKTCCWWW